jgi:hypothetical protein
LLLLLLLLLLLILFFLSMSMSMSISMSTSIGHVRILVSVLFRCPALVLDRVLALLRFLVLVLIPSILLFLRTVLIVLWGWFLYRTPLLKYLERIGIWSYIYRFWNEEYVSEAVLKVTNRES